MPYGARPKCLELRKLQKPPTPLRSVNVRLPIIALPQRLTSETLKVSSHDSWLRLGPHHQAQAAADFRAVRPDVPRRAPLAQPTTLPRAALDQPPPLALRVPQGVPNQAGRAICQAVRAEALPVSGKEAARAAPQRGHVDAGRRVQHTCRTPPRSAHEDQA